jgi:hypothetical protein
MRGCGGAMASWGCGIAVVLAVVLGLLYWLAMPQLDSLLADSLRRAYILPPSCTVLVVRGSLLDTLEGQVKRVYVESPEAKLDGLVVDDLRLLAEGVDFDMVKTLATRSAVLDEVIHGEVSFRIPETALQQLWADELRSQGLTGAAVSVTKNGVKLTGQADLKLAKLPVAVGGKFAAENGQRVKLVLDKFELSGMQLGSGDLKKALAALAPAIDLSRFKMDLEIDKITHTDGAIIVSARTRSLASKQAEDEKAEAAKPEESAGQRLKLPKLDELVKLFVERAPEQAGQDAEAAGGKDGQAGAGEQSHTGAGHE